MIFRRFVLGYGLISVMFLVFSYGFVDRNLILSTHWAYRFIHDPLQYFVYEQRVWAGGVYLFLVLSYWILYLTLLGAIDKKKMSLRDIKKLLLVTTVPIIFSFPAFSYDVFNYMLTAKVTFTHKENPWIVRPIEIPNEPALSYTRAANKVALYGPTWIILTAIPHYLGFGTVWLTIVSFKLTVMLFYFILLFFIFRYTKDLWKVSSFAFNPLILFEIVNGGHNDIVMMVLAIVGLLLYGNKKKGVGMILYASSIFVKGATLVLVPLLLLQNIPKEKLFLWAYWLMFFVLLASPFREEMYPWYFVWCLSCLSFIPKSHSMLYGFSLALSFGLLLRHTPYIITRQYDGVNQTVRTLLTWIPLFIFFLWSQTRRFQKT